MELFVTIVNGWKQLTNVTKRLILDVVVVLDTLEFYSKTILNKHNKHGAGARKMQQDILNLC